MTTMANPTAKLFQQVHFTVSVWVDPAKTDASLWAVVENVDITLKNVVDAAVKELDLPDHGIEVMVE